MAIDDKAEQIEVTPKMIEAAVAVLYESFSGADFLDLNPDHITREIIADVYKAMRALEPKHAE